MGKIKGDGRSNILDGTNRNDLIVGLAGDDTLFGLGGNDTLDGGSGDDELLGGDGNDLLLPGKGGADAIDGGKGIDTVSYANFKTSTGISIGLNTPTSGVGAGDALGDTYASVENFIGSKYADFIVFYDSVNTDIGFIHGGPGDDSLLGPGGIMRGDGGRDALYCDTGRVSAEIAWLQLNKGADVVYNFTDGQDLLQLSGKEFGLGALLNSDELFNKASDFAATGEKAQLIFRQDTSELFLDRDGTGSEAAVLIATIASNSASLSLDDFLII